MTLTREQIEACRSLVLRPFDDLEMTDDDKRLSNHLNALCDLALQAEAMRADRDDMRRFHDASIKELYRMLGVDGSDGEFRFKWAALALSRKLDELKAMREALECAEYAMMHPSSDQAFALKAIRSALGGTALEQALNERKEGT